MQEWKLKHRNKLGFIGAGLVLTPFLIFQNCGPNSASSLATSHAVSAPMPVPISGSGSCHIDGANFPFGTSLKSYNTAVGTAGTPCKLGSSICQSSGSWSSPIYATCQQTCAFNNTSVNQGPVTYYVSGDATCTPQQATCQNDGTLTSTIAANNTLTCQMVGQGCSYPVGAGIAVPIPVAGTFTWTGNTTPAAVYPTLCSTSEGSTATCNASGSWISNGKAFMGKLYSSCTQFCTYNSVPYPAGNYYFYAAGNANDCSQTTTCQNSGLFSSLPNSNIAGQGIYSSCAMVGAPLINSFSSTSMLIPQGQSVTLNWNVTSVGGFPATLTLNGNTVTSSSATVTPSATTTYQLIATNTVNGRIQTATSSVTVQVVGAPMINSFAASATNINPGDSVVLSWSVTSPGGFRTSLTLNGNGVDSTVMVVNPTTTTNYQLSASNTVNGNVQTSTASLTVSVNNASANSGNNGKSVQ